MEKSFEQEIMAIYVAMLCESLRSGCADIDRGKSYRVDSLFNAVIESDPSLRDYLSEKVLHRGLYEFRDYFISD